MASMSIFSFFFRAFWKTYSRHFLYFYFRYFHCLPGILEYSGYISEFLNTFHIFSIHFRNSQEELLDVKYDSSISRTPHRLVSHIFLSFFFNFTLRFRDSQDTCRYFHISGSVIPVCWLLSQIQAMRSRKISICYEFIREHI